MSNLENLNKEEGIIKLKKMVDDVKYCFFSTDLKNEDEPTSTVMTAQTVDDEGNIWFFSGIDSDRNRDIKANKKVQLYFSCPEKNTYLTVIGDASIIIDKAKFAELWNPLLKIWFKDGIEDKNISLLKVETNTANYWDIEGGKMINFFKMVAAAITGSQVNESSQGTIKL
jgi:general stress protein 26